MAIADPDPFNQYTCNIEGTLILNRRGGSLILDDVVTFEGHERIFSEEAEIKLSRFEVDVPGDQPFVLNNLTVKQLRPVESYEESCVAFKFFRLSEKNLDALDDLLGKFPSSDAA